MLETQISVANNKLEEQQKEHEEALAAMEEQLNDAHEETAR